MIKEHTFVKKIKNYEHTYKVHKENQQKNMSKISIFMEFQKMKSYFSVVRLSLHPILYKRIGYRYRLSIGGCLKFQKYRFFYF